MRIHGILGLLHLMILWNLVTKCPLSVVSGSNYWFVAVRHEHAVRMEDVYVISWLFVV